MNVLVIEDEAPAARRLAAQLTDVDPDIHILDILDSIESAVAWLENNDAPDAITMDIQLADGLSFEIFTRTPVVSPVIFTTAYDEYALRAFKTNGIDYLLKPIERDELERSIEKLRNLTGGIRTNSGIDDRIRAIMQDMQLGGASYKTRFLVKSAQRLFPIPTENIAYFYTQDKVSFLVTAGADEYPVDYTLDELERLLDPQRFFRSNRKFILGVSAIRDVRNYFNGKLKVSAQPSAKTEVVISRERAGAFKRWLGQ